MGVTISSESALAPISLASTLIGFISFAFTLATAFRVFYDNIATFFGAPAEINDMLTNLRQSLYEERSNLRRARQSLRRRRASTAKKEPFGSQRDGLTPEDAVQAMAAAVKDMMKSFKAYEKPFLVEGLQDGRRQKSDKEPFGQDLGYSSGGLGEDEHADYLYATNRYRECSFKQRCIWIRYKNKVLGLLESTMRIQVRRIGFQTSHLSLLMRQQMHNFDEFQDRLDGLDRLEQRLSRIVGVRRLE